MTNRKKTPDSWEFEDFLREEHAKGYCGLDDLMTDDYEDWLQSLDVQEVIDYAEQALKQERERVVGEIDRELRKIYFMNEQSNEMLGNLIQKLNKKG